MLRKRNVRNRELWILIMPIRLWPLQAEIENITQQTIWKLRFVACCGCNAIPKACHRLEYFFLSYSSFSSLCHLIFFFYDIISLSAYWLYLLSLICSQIFYVIILAIFHIDSLQRCILLSFPCLHFHSFNFSFTGYFLIFFLYRNNMLSFFIQNSSFLSYMPFLIYET